MGNTELNKIQKELLKISKWTALVYIIAVYLISATAKYVFFMDKIANWLYLGLFFLTMIIQLVLVFSLLRFRIEAIILMQLIILMGSYVFIGRGIPIVMGMAPVILLEIWNFSKGKERMAMLVPVVLIFSAMYFENIFKNFSIGHTIILLELGAFVTVAALYTQTTFTRQFIELKKSQKLYAQLESVYDQVEQTTIEVERDRIARDFHDSIIQQIIGNLLNLEATANEMKKGGSREKSLAEIEHVIDQSREMVINSRAIVKNLKTNRDLNLETRINILSSTFKKNYHLDVQSTIKGHPDFSSEVFYQLEMIIHECLINVSKHSNVHSAIVLGEPNGDKYCVRIIDFGKGFDVKNVPKGGLNFGLKNISERAKSINGSFEINSVKGEGTTIIVNVPLGGSK